MIPLLTIFTTNVWADEYSWLCNSTMTFSTSGAALAGASSSSVIWTASQTGSSQGTGVSGEKCVQLPKNTGLTLSTSSISGTISSIVIQTWGSQGNSLTCAVGSSYSNTQNINTGYSSSGSKTTFSNISASGTITLTWSSESKAFNVRQIIITYSSTTSYTITYNNNGGSGSMSNTTGASVSAASCTFTPPTGKVFSSWNTEAGGGGTSYAAGATVNATVTLYAQWVSDWELGYGVSGSSWGDPVTMTIADGVASATISLSAMTKYEFKFHQKSAGGAAGYWGNSGGVIITDISNWDFGTDASNCRLFTGPSGSYTFTFNVSTHKAAVSYPSVSHPAAGYAYFKKQGSDTYISVYTHHNDAACEVANWAGSVQVTNKTTLCGNDYFYFALTDAGGCSKAIIRYNNNGSQKGDFTITSGAYSGKWGSVDDTNWHDFTTYSVTFHGNNNTGGSMTDVTGICPNGSTTLVTNGYSRTGYDFNGWNTQAGGGGTSYANLATISSINADIDLYAQWSAKTISITLDKNNNDASGSTSGSTSIKYDATAVLSSPTHATRTGYTLEGYYAESGCTHKVMTNAGVLVNYSGYVESGKWVRTTNPTTLYANWTPIPYHVTWYVEGTALTGLADGLTTVNYGSKVTALPSTPGSTCEGEFVGWTTSADAVYNKNVTDNYTTNPTTFNTQAGSPTITGDITFYAVFKKRMED